MKILIVGDVHLDKGTSIGKNIPGEYNSRNQDKIKLLDWVIEQVIKNDVDRIVFTGDIFEHSKPDYLVLEIWLKFLEKIHNLRIHPKKQNQVHVDIIYGNHDMKRIGDKYFSALDLLSYLNYNNISLHNKINYIECSDNQNNETKIVFVPFRDRRSYNVDSNQKALELLEKEIQIECDDKALTHILIGHLTLEGSLYVGDEIDDYHNELICPTSMFRGYERVYMGHIHKPQEIAHQIEHIGSLDISDFGETDHQKILILLDTDINKVTKINVPCRPLRLVDCTIPDLEEPQKYLENFITSQEKILSFKDAIVKVIVKYSNKESINRKETEKLLYKLGSFNVCSFIEKKTINTIPTQKKNLMAGIAEPKSAVKTYTENNQKFIDDQYKTDFIDFCELVIDKMESK